eukprot:TRINITY_DN6807_c0_g1_i2.p2 TRINITY_DN6807_c0_g1~~TRINITY_DN6807_c0_g1_i2.p2  ORF type:complete len:105 (+),score=18.34 TRINITY_DN6807_c0_g1_i2:192-506(+)
MLMLHRLLRLYDDDVAYSQARTTAKRMTRGTAGVDYGNKATILDAILLLQEVWDSPSELSMDVEDHVDESRQGSKLAQEDLGSLHSKQALFKTPLAPKKSLLQR